MVTRRFPLFAVAALSLWAPAAALAQSDADKATARQLASDAQDALDKKDYATAVDRFTRADDLYHAPTLVLGLARAQVGLHHYVAAQEAYNRILRDGAPAGAPPAFKKAVDDAKHELSSIEGRVAWVTISVSGPSAPKVTLDGANFPAAALGVKRAVDPGSHTVSATGDGYETKDKTFNIAEGGSESVSLALSKGSSAAPVPIASAAPSATPSTEPSSTPAPETPPAKGSSRKMLGFVGLGIGVIGVGLGAVTGILALGKHGTLNDECPNGCPSSAQSDIDGYHTMGLISTIGFIAGGVGLAGGAVLILTAPKDQAPPPAAARVTVRPVLGPGTAGLAGSF
jgi:hypothetical protein